MKSSKIIAVVIAVIALIWIGSGFIGGGGDSAAPVSSAEKQTEKKLVEVRVREIEAKPYADDVVVTGRTQASRRVLLKAETSGQIAELLKEEGDAVTEGEDLVNLEVRDRAAKVTEARQRVNQRQIEYNASKKLVAKGFNSKVRAAQSLADLENAKAELKQAEIDQSKTAIKAPFEGIIAEQEAEIGDYLAVGDTVFTVVDLDPIELVGFVSERRIHEISLGKEAVAEFLNAPDLKGTVSYIAPAADEQTRTFRVVISAPNPDYTVKAGLTARLRIPVTDKKAHKISPSILSLNDAGKVGVKLVNRQNKVEFMPVQILADKPDGMWIMGPPEKARFITVGQEFVIDGQSVKPVKAQGDGLL